MRRTPERTGCRPAGRSDGVVAGGLCGAAPAGKSGPTVDYAREVRPILAKNCFACHGTDEKTRAGGLRLDRRDDAAKPLKSGSIAIAPALLTTAN